MKNIKKDNGITLISLVVTIVVMLILASVSINLIVGDGGIIKVTKQIKNNTIEAETEAQNIINNLKEETYKEDGTIIVADKDAPIINSMKIIHVDNTSFRVNINITEKESGIKEIRYSKDDGKTYETDPKDSKSKTYTYNNVNPEIYRIKVQIEDNDGNIAEVNKDFEFISFYQQKSNDMLDKKENTTLNINGQEITIPAGYKLAQDSADTIDEGMVITDAPGNGNEWVWIPVPDVTVICDTANTTEYTLSGTSGENAVKAKLYSKSEIISGQERTTPGTTTSPDYREPDLIVGEDGASYDAIEANRNAAGLMKNETVTMTKEEMAQVMVDNYKEMIESIGKYKGFYIGRYELSKAGEKKDQPALTNTTWYNLYKKCTELKASDKVRTEMIWGCQWDVACNWIANKGDKKDITDSKSWGNYKDSIAPANTGNYESNNKKNTGSNEAWVANNVYDLAGNCYEWTQEAISTNSRAARGGFYDDLGSNRPASYRSNNFPATDGASALRFSCYFNSKT